MKTILTLLLCLIPLISSCSSTKDKKFRDEVDTELVESFDLNDQKFEKFKVVEIKEDAKNEVKEDKNKKSPKVKTKKKVATKPKKKPNKKVVVKKKEPVKKKNEKVVEKKTTYPEDYPEDFIKYNEKYKYVWDRVEPFFFPHETFVLSASYLGVTVGHAKLETLPVVNVAGKKAFHFKGSLKSASFYNYIYEVEDWVESYVDAHTFLPIKYTLVQRESGQDVDDLQLFDSDALKTYFWYKRLKKGKVKKKELNAYVPKYFQDSFSALYFVRGLDLKVGNKYEFPIITRAKLWLMKMEVLKIERIKVLGEWQDAYRIKAETRFPGVLKKKGDIIFWFSTDKYRKILKFKANVKIGAIKGELVEYKKGDEKFKMEDLGN
jgi:hypothetical protein